MRKIFLGCCLFSLYLFSADLKTDCENSSNKSCIDHGDDFYKNRNYVEALKWYKIASDRGDAIAQLSLGSMYEFGEGVSINFDNAFELYNLSAKQGLSEAKNNLGLLYLNGKGTEINKGEAYRNFLESSKDGYEDAQENLKLFCEENFIYCEK